MSNLQSLLRSTEIIKLGKGKAFDWKTLEQHLARKEGEMDRILRISKRTLKQDLDEINEVFGIAIKFDYKTGLYTIICSKAVTPIISFGLLTPEILFDYCVAKLLF